MKFCTFLIVSTVLQDDSDPDFNIEEILDVRVKRGQKEYLLKWEGYDSSQNTWEPARNVDAPELVAAFEEKLKQKVRKKCVFCSTK